MQSALYLPVILLLPWLGLASEFEDHLLHIVTFADAPPITRGMVDFETGVLGRARIKPNVSFTLPKSAERVMSGCRCQQGKLQIHKVSVSPCGGSVTVRGA